MNTRLLRRLRKEAKKYIYLCPWKFVDDKLIEVIIVNRKYKDIDLIYYYGKNVQEADSICSITQGYSFDEGLEELKILRREYILFEARILKKEQEDETQKKLRKRAQKILNKY